MGRYTVVPGQFPCHTCKQVVPSLRHYTEDRLLTWVCSEKHLSQVSLNAKKSKKDYEREK
jgi:hypothetical protein